MISFISCIMSQKITFTIKQCKCGPLNKEESIQFLYRNAEKSISGPRISCFRPKHKIWTHGAPQHNFSSKTPLMHTSLELVKGERSGQTRVFAKIMKRNSLPGHFSPLSGSPASVGKQHTPTLQPRPTKCGAAVCFGSDSGRKLSGAEAINY